MVQNEHIEFISLYDRKSPRHSWRMLAHYPVGEEFYDHVPVDGMKGGEFWASSRITHHISELCELEKWSEKAQIGFTVTMGITNEDLPRNADVTVLWDFGK